MSWFGVRTTQTNISGSHFTVALPQQQSQLTTAQSQAAQQGIGGGGVSSSAGGVGMAGSSHFFDTRQYQSYDQLYGYGMAQQVQQMQIPVKQKTLTDYLGIMTSFGITEIVLNHDHFINFIKDTFSTQFISESLKYNNGNSMRYNTSHGPINIYSNKHKIENKFDFTNYLENV